MYKVAKEDLENFEQFKEFLGCHYLTFDELKSKQDLIKKLLLNLFSYSMKLEQMSSGVLILLYREGLLQCSFFIKPSQVLEVDCQDYRFKVWEEEDLHNQYLETDFYTVHEVV